MESTKSFKMGCLRKLIISFASWLSETKLTEHGEVFLAQHNYGFIILAESGKQNRVFASFLGDFLGEKKGIFGARSWGEGGIRFQFLSC